MWKKLAVLVMVALLPISAVAHTKLFYRMSCRSYYRNVEVITPTPESMVTQEPTVTHLVEILLESTLTPEPTLTPITDEIPTPTPSVEIIDTEDILDTTDQITTPSDVDFLPTPKDLF